MSEKKITKYIQSKQTEYSEAVQPIFEIMLFQYPDKELISPSGKHLGFPDEGAMDNPGFYYDLHDSIEALHHNACDIREGLYNAAFILCRFPGLYDAVGKEGRLYFLWNEERHGFFETEEPEIFLHIAY